MLHYQPRNGKAPLARVREPLAVIKRKQCFSCDMTGPAVQHRGAWLCTATCAPKKPMDKVNQP